MRNARVLFEMGVVGAFVLLYIQFAWNEAWGTTWYVWKNGSPDTALCGTSTICFSAAPWGGTPSAVSDLEGVIEHSFVSAGDLLLIDGGTLGVSHVGYEIDSDSLLSIDKRLTIRGCRSADAGCSGHTGGVTISCNGAAGVCVKTETNAGSTLENLKIANVSSNSGSYLLQLDVATTVNDIELTMGHTALRCGSASTINRLYAHDVDTRWAYVNGSPEINYSVFQNVTGALYGVNLSGSSSAVLTNCTFSGAAGTAILFDSTENVTINNPLIYNVGLTNGGAYPITEDGSGTLIINNPLVLPNNVSLDFKIASGAPVINSPKYESPMHTNGKYPAIVVFQVDDAANINYFKMLATKLEAYGWNGTFALSDATTGNILETHHPTYVDWPELRALVAKGHELSVHGNYCMHNVPDMNGIVVRYVGAGAACSLTISADKRLITTVDGSTHLNLDLTLGTYDRLSDIVPYLNNHPDYTCTMANTDGGHASAYLTVGSVADIKTAAQKVDLDPARVYQGEITDPKTALEENIPGYTVKTWTGPGHNIHAAIRSRLLVDGYFGARGKDRLNDTNIRLSSANAYGIAWDSMDRVIGANDPTEAQVKQNLGRYLEWLKWRGGICVLYGHHELAQGLTAAGIDKMLVEVKRHVDAGHLQVMTLADAAAFVKTYDPSGDLTTSDSMTYTRTLVKNSDYYLPSSASPVINSGIAVSSVHNEPILNDFGGVIITDESGHWLSLKYGANPDIGAFEYDMAPDDRDGDGLPDALEEPTGTNPRDCDTDDDGLRDGDEDMNHDGSQDGKETNPRLADSDGDGVQDGTEKGLTHGIPDPDGPGDLHGTDNHLFIPDLDPASFTDPLSMDCDLDGLLDGQEDLNRNGRRDQMETDPTKADTDEDGYTDGAELVAGTDPLDHNSHPVETPAAGAAVLAMSFAVMFLTGLGHMKGRRPINQLLNDTSRP